MSSSSLARGAQVGRAAAPLGRRLELGRGRHAELVLQHLGAHRRGGGERVAAVLGSEALEHLH